ncbi:hypothetical protein D9M68_767790 [compost metagenome]
MAGCGKRHRRRGAAGLDHRSFLVPGLSWRACRCGRRDPPAAHAGAAGRRQQRADHAARAASGVRARDALGHGAAGAVPRALHTHGAGGGRIRRGAGAAHAAGHARSHHRRTLAPRGAGRLGHAARGRCLAGGRGHARGRTQGTAGHRGTARRGQGPLQHGGRLDADGGGRPACPVRHGGLRGLALRGAGA